MLTTPTRPFDTLRFRTSTVTLGKTPYEKATEKKGIESYISMINVIYNRELSVNHQVELLENLTL